MAKFQALSPVDLKKNKILKLQELKRQGQTPVFYIPSIYRYITLGQYVKAVQQARENRGQRFDRSFEGWTSCTGQDIVNQFVNGVHERISWTR